MHRVLRPAAGTLRWGALRIGSQTLTRPVEGVCRCCPHCQGVETWALSPKVVSGPYLSSSKGEYVLCVCSGWGRQARLDSILATNLSTRLLLSHKDHDRGLCV
eukprot:4478531-Pleurochrysis_carterae.AAC.1